ncbi:MAG: C1 family peptidase [Adlercreutzia sp.]|nr:C1 family peptidase [Adlercreutzia sp.]
MKISKEQIEKMHESFKKCETQQVAQKAVTVNGILKSAEDVEVLKRLSPANFAFSIDVDKEAVANQLMSGRCWMFACLNTLRFRIEKELDLPHGTFELSQAYLAFYNKLERAAWFMKHIVETADKDLNDREVTWLIQSPMQDGGDWDMVAALVKKYGVVPHSAMSETHCTNNTSEVNTVLSHLLRQDALKLRTMAREGKDTEAVQEEMLNEVYRILAVCFGEPVQKFDFQYEDKKGNYHADYDLTPLEFYKKYVGLDLDDYIGVINVPGDENPYGRTYTIEDSDQIPERENLYLNVEMDDLKQMVIAQLKAGEPVWFGCDVLQHCDRMKGVMDMDLYDLEAMFGIKFTMNKAERYAMRESLPTHAMVIAGVDLDKDGKPTKWKIENSWGTENGGKKTGNNGYFVCGDEWFDNFVYEVAINKKFMTAEQQKALSGEPIVWPFWATFNPVSA